MEGAVDKKHKDHKAAGSNISHPLMGLKKYSYVLPSGRIMKVVVEDERELAANTA